MEQGGSADLAPDGAYELKRHEGIGGTPTIHQGAPGYPSLVAAGDESTSVQGVEAQCALPSDHRTARERSTSGAFRAPVRLSPRVVLSPWVGLSPRVGARGGDLLLQELALANTHVVGLFGVGVCLAERAKGVQQTLGLPQTGARVLSLDHEDALPSALGCSKLLP